MPQHIKMSKQRTPTIIVREMDRRSWNVRGRKGHRGHLVQSFHFADEGGGGQRLREFLQGSMRSYKVAVPRTLCRPPDFSLLFSWPHHAA